MNMPGFNAEASLYKSDVNYSTIMKPAGASGGQAVIPQQYWSWDGTLSDPTTCSTFDCMECMYWHDWEGCMQCSQHCSSVEASYTWPVLITPHLPDAIPLPHYIDPHSPTYIRP
jgi:hypothetical protein